MTTPVRSKSSITFDAKRSGIARHVFLPLQRHLHDQTLAGVVLVVAAALAMIWANSPWHETYRGWNEMPLAINLGGFSVSHTVHDWINDALMAVFFFLVGLEIKNQCIHGELSTFRKALLPFNAAVGGMIFPALIYFGFNAGFPSARGWGIPVATDIAFALGVMALVGDRVPPSLRVFLLALATVDDIGGILVIAIFYSSQIAWIWLAVSALLVVLMHGLTVGGVRHFGPYAVLGIALWIAVFSSGIHPTIAGVVTGLLIPGRAWLSETDFHNAASDLLIHYKKALSRKEGDVAQALSEEMTVLAQHTEALSERLERQFRPWVTWIVLPFFALSNSGVEVSGRIVREAFSHPVASGVFFGLLAGKISGIVGFSWLTVKIGLAVLPTGVHWRHVFATGLLAGIGFTVSLFITGLSFDDPSLSALAKLSVLAASVVAAASGYLLLRITTRNVRNS